MSKAASEVKKRPSLSTHDFLALGLGVAAASALENSAPEVFVGVFQRRC